MLTFYGINHMFFFEIAQLPSDIATLPKLRYLANHHLPNVGDSTVTVK